MNLFYYRLLRHIKKSNIENITGVNFNKRDCIYFANFDKNRLHSVYTYKGIVFRVNGYIECFFLFRDRNNKNVFLLTEDFYVEDTVKFFIKEISFHEFINEEIFYEKVLNLMIKYGNACKMFNDKYKRNPHNNDNHYKEFSKILKTLIL
jgi:hypothetical protein